MTWGTLARRLAALACVFSAACVVRPPAPPTPPSYFVQVIATDQVTGQRLTGPMGAQATRSDADGFTWLDAEGTAAWTFDRLGVELCVQMTTGTYERSCHRVVQAGTVTLQLAPKPPPPVPEPQPEPQPQPIIGSHPVAVAGGAFREADGKIWKYRGVTAFSALSLAIKGDWDRLERYAAWSTSIGANTWRIFGIWGNAQLTGRENGYYERLAQLLDWMAARGLTAHFVAFTDQVENSPVRLTSAQQIDHAVRVADVLRGRHALLEWSNEDWKNGDIARDFNAVPGVLTTRSAWPDGADPVYARELILDWSVHHTPRDPRDEWMRKSKELVDIARLGVVGLPATHLPAVASEPIRLAEATPREYAAYLAVAEMFGAGGLLHGGFHSLDPNTGDDDLQACVAPAPGSHAWNVGEAVKAVWAAGIPPEAASEWQYSRGPFSNMPLAHDDALALRTFAMLGGDRAVAVVVHHDPPNARWTPIAQDGWRIDQQIGDVFLFRR